jgi:hypothetical protein
MNGWRDKVTAETVFLAAVVTVSAWMLYRTYSFGWSTAFFPRWMAILVLVSVGFLLLKRVLPEEFLDRFADDTTSTYGEIDTRTVDEKQSMMVAGQFVVFIVSSYLFGFLISAIWYVYAILHVYEYGKFWQRALYAGTTGVVVYLGYLVMGIDLTFGVFLDWMDL